MAELTLERQVKARDEVVWAVISDLAALPELAPEIRKVELLDASDGQVRRRCHDHGDRTWTEHSVDWVDGDHYTMEVEAPAYAWMLSQMRCTYAMKRSGGAVTLSLRYEYAPAYSFVGALAERLSFRARLRDNASLLLDNWVARIRERELGYKVTVATVLRRKGSDVVTVPVTATLAEVADVLCEHRIGCVMVMEQGRDSEVRGLCSERDIVRGVHAHGADALSMPVTSVMATELVVAAPENDMFFLMACMSERRIRHLPVIENGRLHGIISIGDVVKERIDELETEHETMREYIAGREWRYHQQMAAVAAEVPETSPLP